jgi:hypothetical protein
VRTAVSRRYAGQRGNALILEQYRRYPYYAIHSELLGKLSLDAQTLRRIEAVRPTQKAAGLVTIGYEGRSLEGYLNVLLREAVTEQTMLTFSACRI